MKSILTIALLLASSSAMAATTNITENNSKTKVDQRAIYVPPITPLTPPSTVAVGNIMRETTPCGPLQTLVKTPIDGQFMGFFKQVNVAQGFTYELAPFMDAEGRMQFYKELPIPGSPGGYRVIGHQAIIFSTVVGLSSTRNIAIGGSSSSGSWGQAGGGASSSTTQVVTNIQLRQCELGSFFDNTLATN